MLQALYNRLTAAMVALPLLAQPALAADENAVEPDHEIKVQSMTRLNMIVGSGFCGPVMPVAEVKASSGNWVTSGGVAMDHTRNFGACLSNYDFNLDFATVQYQGETVDIEVGLFPAHHIGKAPLVDAGFTSVIVGNRYVLNPGVTGARVTHEVDIDEKTSASFDALYGTQNMFKHFEVSHDQVVVGGVEVKRTFNTGADLEAGYQRHEFTGGSDPNVGDFIYINAGMPVPIAGESAKIRFYGENYSAQNSDQNRYSVVVSSTVPVGEATDFEVATGWNDVGPSVEASLYHSDKNGGRTTFGIGHGFGDEDNVVRLGFIAPY